MEFLLLDRKFKLVDDVLYSFYKHGNSKTDKWYIVKLSFNKDGYKRFAFRLEGKFKQFYYHRVVYYANNPQWDIYDNSINNLIDHIDGEITNNHISNLRNVSQQENTFNTRCKGYSFNKEIGKYQARIILNGKKNSIGYYDSEDEAHQAYLNKKEVLHIIIQR